MTTERRGPRPAHAPSRARRGARGPAEGAVRALRALGVLALVLLAAVPPRTAGAQAPPPPEAGRPVPVTRHSGGDRVATAVAVSEAAYPSATAAVLARADDFADALVAAPLAAQRGAPILLTGRTALPVATAAELDRLGVDEVILLGGDDAIGSEVAAGIEDGGRTVTRLSGTTRFDTAAAAAMALDGPSDTVHIATGTTFPDALAGAPLAAAEGSPILLVTADAVPAATREALEVLAPQRIVLLGGTNAIGTGVAEALGAHGTVERLSGSTRFGTAAAVHDAAVEAGADPGDLWLADGRDFPDALVAGPVIGATGGTLLLVDGAHLAAQPEPYERIRLRGDALRQVTLLGGTAAINANAPAQIDGIVRGSELPRGGRLLFPQHRMVALYGNARSAAMGALGEQPPGQAAQRVLEAAAPYETPGRVLLPAFELIVTVATRAPGEDGLHRSAGHPEEVERYLSVAREHDLYLVLDIQPGRSDFLTEVQRYERYLREPDVGVALDPEWRMAPDQVPGETVGTVDAAEVNQVVDYLAGIVAEHRLPQKLLVVHQFQHRMITNRDAIRAPEELSVLYHADGFGSRAAKLSKYEAFLAPRPYAMGFKLFYDEDTDLFRPAEVLGFRVPPDFISYQ